MRRAKRALSDGKRIQPAKSLVPERYEGWLAGVRRRMISDLELKIALCAPRRHFTVQMAPATEKSRVSKD
jgi:hypothetical protein